MKSQLILESKGVRFEVIDVSDPCCQAEKKEMQTKARAKEGERNAIPPQFFNDDPCEPWEPDDTYCGDYDGFDRAVESDQVEEFLKLPRGTLPQVPIILHDIFDSREVGFPICHF